MQKMLKAAIEGFCANGNNPYEPESPESEAWIYGSQANRDRRRMQDIRLDRLMIPSSTPLIEDLVTSIKKIGVINRILVRYCGADHYEIIVGRRRAAAAKAAGLTVVPCEVQELTNAQVIAIRSLKA